MGLFKYLKKTLQSVPSAGWRILEPFSGAWQQNISYSRETILAFHAVFSCVSLISSDIAKLRPFISRFAENIWTEIPLGKYKVIAKPNSYQNRIQFYESWIASKLIRGNTYALKERDSRGDVVALYVLNPDLVQVLVSDSGDVFYQLSQDNLSGLERAIVAPASEIIHDRFNCFYHPLVGLSPITACGLAAYQGLKIQQNSAMFFQNLSRPSGILTAPGIIRDETAVRLKTDWETNYAGDKIGKVAVLGDDLKYTPLSLTAEESQMVDQLKLTADIVSTTFHVPAYKTNGTAPTKDNVEALEQQYYSQCLQVLIESLELCLDEGLEIPDNIGVEMDLLGLLRMDSSTQISTLSEAVKGGLKTPNEARRRLNDKPLEGGDTIYLQQQYYSLSALAKRDASEDPFGTSKKETTAIEPADTKPDDQTTDDEEDVSEDDAKAYMDLIEKDFPICAYP